MKVTISTYWKCQLIGWTIWSLTDYILVSISDPDATDLIMRVAIACLFGLAGTHLLRFIIKRFRILDKKLGIQIIYLLLVIIVFDFFAIWLLIWVLEIIGVSDKNLGPYFFRSSFFGHVIYTYNQSLIIAISWTAIYFLVHYVGKIKKTEQEKAALRIKLVESEVQALRVQMNPQFIFNGMNTIKSYISKNENDKAANYLTTLSKLIRTLFQNSDKREVSLHEELETYRLYTALEKMRFGDKVEFVFNVDEQLDLKDIKVPALVLQPFIENAIWHGLAPKETGGKVTVGVSQNNGTVECIVDDDGIGRELSAQYKAQHGAICQKGAGLTQSRLNQDKLLNERQDLITIIDKKDETGQADGTKVIITFKEK